ncbi:SRPBCC domain-containing protein [Chitinophaga rhizophila]|uniref:SRPBCC domain-containing protein n=1 Tax=Chitinophaga rhizophila TaxID=2866212 RepID=A0ABS7G6B3_9BACT|nr:SRPBCC domain-containing protein [Chitinophaga rhizophila]MBW8683001.1 SRPBCC domain-containing protein [Chitinophaga rhizophila]
MERKTQVHAAEGRHDLTITREFDLPVALLFKAYEEAELLAQWMGTKVVKLESRKHGCWQFETSDPKGNVMFRANGTYHEFIPEKKITRTFEMENAPFDVQLEFLDFEALTDNTSKLTMHVIYKSNELRDQMLKLPFAYGINMAHDRLQEIVHKLK